MSRGRGSGTRQSPMMRAEGPADMITTRSDKRDRLFEIMGDEQHRLAVGAPQVEQQVAHDLPRLRVERTERLVHQQDFRIADQHLRQADALALAAGQHVRIARAEGAKPDAREPVCARPRASARGVPAVSRPIATFSSAVFQGNSASDWNR